MDEIIAGYGFYIGWSFGATAVLMIGEWIYTDIQRKAVIKQLKRMSRLNESSDSVKQA